MSARAPQISIALATCNGERWLDEQLESLLAQTLPPCELVACDDASSDGTWAMLERFAPRFGSARLLRNPRNLGLRANFERVLRQCRGEWIAPCDQDDVWRADKLERLAAAIGPDTTLVYSDSELIDAEGRALHARVSDRLTLVDGHDPRVFALANCVSGHAMLIRRSVLDAALPLPDGVYHDWWLAFVAANLGAIRLVDEPLVRFRQHTTNASAFGGRRGADKPLPAQRHAAQQRDLDALAAFDGPERAFFVELAALWRTRSGHALAPALAAFLWRHRRAVFASRKPAPGSARHALRYLWGVRSSSRAAPPRPERAQPPR
ncbi:MAG: glycosyltransferase family 2 protein [Betaproteobacteria bacterium]